MDQTDTQQAQSERKAAFQIARERAIAEGTAISKRSPAVPQTIYHYTDAQGLMGIQSEQKLWATNAKFLNDEYELSWAMNVYNNAIMLAAPESEGEQELLERISRSANLLHSGLEIFCCSFSEKGDDLNQWRGYAGTASPYAIGMRAGRLSVGISYAELMSVIYDEAEQLEIASALVDLTLRLYRDHADKAEKPYDNEAVGMCSHSFRVMSSYSSIRFKSPHWSSEHEWRLIAVLSSDELKANMHFKAGRFGVVPYMKLGMDVPGIHHLPIEEVVVGPTPLREASLEATRMYFRNQDMMTPDVRASTVPIR